MFANLIFTLALVLTSTVFIDAASAVEIGWRVENRFRFYKDDGASFQRHVSAFEAVCPIAAGERKCSTDVKGAAILQMERWLNAQVYPERSQPASQAGWAAHSYKSTCWNSLSGLIDCDRSGRADAGAAYLLPKTHRVAVGPSDGSAAKSCSMRWAEIDLSGALGPWREVGAFSCGLKPHDWPTITVPWDPTGRAGAKVELSSDGVSPKAAEIRVRDLLILGMGDSLGSGEGNPDNPVKLSSSAWINYKANSGDDPGRPVRSVAVGLSDEERNAPVSAGVNKPFRGAAAGWLDARCHRSQYSNQFRTALQLAVESPQIAVTFVPLGCSGAMLDTGLLGKQEQREGNAIEDPMVRAQIDVVTALLCEQTFGRKSEKTWKVDAISPPKPGASRVAWNACLKLKRDVDLVLLSIGGNDIGFSGLAGNVILDKQTYIGKLLGLVSRGSFVKPTLADLYLEVLPHRLSLLKTALTGVEKANGVSSVPLVRSPDRVVQIGYFPPDRDQDGNTCGASAATRRIGADVSKAFKYDATEMSAVGTFMRSRLFPLMACFSDWSASCSAFRNADRMKRFVGVGTGFRYVDGFQPEFGRHGICSRPSGGADAGNDEVLRLRMPRVEGGTPNTWSVEKPAGGPDSTGWDPHAYWPYDRTVRWMVTPNDAFMKANTHKETWSINDLGQPVYASTYSGAFHPNAQGHAFIADYEFCEARRALKEILGPTPDRCSALPARID